LLPPSTPICERLRVGPFPRNGFSADGSAASAFAASAFDPAVVLERMLSGRTILTVLMGPYVMSWGKLACLYSCLDVLAVTRGFSKAPFFADVVD